MISFSVEGAFESSKNHKRRDNVAHTPSEICECNQRVEDIRHFLFESPSYAPRRATLTISVIEILQRKSLVHLGNQPDLFLYGHQSLNPIGNGNLLLSTIKYIKDTSP